MLKSLFVTLLMAATTAVYASSGSDRAPSGSEHQSIASTLQSAGCKGGHIEVDQEHGRLKYYEVKYATCDDGRIYEIKINPDFEIIKKERED